MARYAKDDRVLELELDGSALIIRTGESGGLKEDRRICEGKVQARWEHDQRVARAIAEGFRTTTATEAPAGERHAELEEAIRCSPEDPDAYLVYADWLQGLGDARGELICVQHAIAEHRRRSKTDKERFFSEQALALERAELLLMMMHREQLLGPVLSQVDSVAQQRYVMDRFELEWFLGFIRHASLPRSPRRDDNETALWTALLQATSATFIRAIALDWADLDQVTTADLPSTLNAIEVVLDNWWAAEQEEDARRVEVEAMTLDQAVGPPAEHGTRILEALAPLLDGAAPGLRQLTLHHWRFGAVLLDMLVASPLREQLRELDLSHGALTDQELSAVVAAAAALKLERFDLRRNRFSSTGRAKLRALGGSVVIEDR